MDSSVDDAKDPEKQLPVSEDERDLPLQTSSTLQTEKPQDPIQPEVTPTRAENPLVTRRYKAFMFLKQLLQDMKVHKLSWPFRRPVDPISMEATDYYDVIQFPIDISTIMQSLSSGAYGQDYDKIFADLVLLFDNCFHYNCPNSKVSLLGQKLFKWFTRRIHTSGLFLPAEIEFMQTVNPMKYFYQHSPGETAPPSFETSSSSSSLRNPPTTDPRQRVSRVPPPLDVILASFEGDTTPLSEEEISSLLESIGSLPDIFIDSVNEFIFRLAPNDAKETSSSRMYYYEVSTLPPKVLRHLQQYVEKCVSSIQAPPT